MSIQHKDIPEAQLHEPKGVSLATSGKVYIADGAGSGAWAKLTEDIIDFTNKTKNRFGWNDISDNQYSVGSPRAISSATRTLLTNNGLAAQTDVSRLGSIWNAGPSQFLINDLNATYQLRVQYKVKAAAAAGTPYVVKLEVESATGPVVIASVDSTIKGGGYENCISQTFPIYIGSVINNAAMKLYVTADTNITLYDIGFVIQRLYKET